MRLRTRTVVQTLCLLSFIALVLLGGAAIVGPLPLDLWLRLDPLVSLYNPITSRDWVPTLWGGLAILALTPILGRFFCGYMCPLGTTFDLGRKCMATGGEAKDPPAAESSRRWWKYGFLTAITIAASFTIPAVFLGAPIAWATRIYALLLYPTLLLAAGLGIELITPFSDLVGSPAYLIPAVPRYDLQLVLTLCAIAMVGSVGLTPRFWCRYLCPAGALLALFSRRPLLRRKVSADCIQCGTCIKNCPMRAIDDSPYRTQHSECIACSTCVNVCPKEAIQFWTDPLVPPPLPRRERAVRRFLLASGLAGAGYAVLSLTQLRQLHGRPGPGQLVPTRLIRPPGALPEADFLTHCIRCGLCNQVCPTNTLQPLGLAAGLGGLYSPRVLPRRGACEPRCNACGTVCPTSALRALPLDEKQWAKIGTARIIPQRCLAWAQDKACLVCDEVCPYDAVNLRPIRGQAVAVPFVNASRCSGCGYCEHHCPVKADAAIVVGPMDALRLSTGSYRDQGHRQGLQLELKPVDRSGLGPSPSDAVPPLPTDALPPGFSD